MASSDGGSTDDEQQHLKQQLRKVEQKLTGMTIPMGTPLNPLPDPCYLTKEQRERHQYTLKLPNELYLLWEEKADLLQRLIPSARPPSLVEMLNRTVRDQLIVHREPHVEERLQMKSLRFFRDYRNKKKGSNYRSKLLAKSSILLLYKGEADVPHISSEPNQLVLQGRPYHMVETKQKGRKVTKVQKEVKKFLEPLKDAGLLPVKLQLRQHNQENLDVNLLDGNERTSSECSENDRDILRMAHLQVKHSISQKLYHELYMFNKSLPKPTEVTAFRKSIPMPPITKTPGDFDGAQFEFEGLLQIVADLEVAEHYESHYKHTKKIKIRISGDGASYSRTSKFCLLSFAIFRDCKTFSCQDIHVIAAIKADETYDNLKTGFGDVINSINSLIQAPVLVVDEELYELEFFFVSDYKFTLCVLGMKEANSNYACVWCTIHKDLRHKMEPTAEESASIKTRTLSTIKHHARRGWFGCQLQPLFNIEVDHIIPDELHLLLRVMDVLIRNVINSATGHDSHTTRGRCADPLKGPMLECLVNKITACGVNFKVRKGDNGSLEWTSLVGPDKLKVLKSLPPNFSQCQPSDIHKLVENLWKDFESIYESIKSVTPPSRTYLEAATQKWIENFIDISKAGKWIDGYQARYITPYLHIMHAHFPSFVEKYNGIRQFSCQSIEKTNDIAKSTYFSGSNRWDAPVDILTHNYRLYHLQAFERPKRIHTKRSGYWNGGDKEGSICDTRRKRTRISRS